MTRVDLTRENTLEEILEEILDELKYDEEVGDLKLKDLKELQKELSDLYDEGIIEDDCLDLYSDLDDYIFYLIGICEDLVVETEDAIYVGSDKQKYYKEIGMSERDFF